MISAFLALSTLVTGLGGNGFNNLVASASYVIASKAVQDFSGQGAWGFGLLVGDNYFGNYVTFTDLNGGSFRVDFDSPININYNLRFRIENEDEDTIFTTGLDYINLWNTESLSIVYQFNEDYTGYETQYNFTFYFEFLDNVTFTTLINAGENDQAIWQNGYDSGKQEGSQISYDNGYQVGKQEGYAEGYQEGVSSDAVVASIASAIMQFGILPVNVFLAMFNYELLGINIAGLVGGVLTIACIVIAFRTIFQNGGGKQ